MVRLCATTRYLKSDLRHSPTGTQFVSHFVTRNILSDTRTILFTDSCSFLSRPVPKRRWHPGIWLQVPHPRLVVAIVPGNPHEYPDRSRAPRSRRTCQARTPPRGRASVMPPKFFLSPLCVCTKDKKGVSDRVANNVE
jgi:hypothetical protein